MLFRSLKLENCMALRQSFGGPAERETTRQLEEIEQFIQSRTGGEEGAP